MRKLFIGALMGVFIVGVVDVGVATADTKGGITSNTKYTNNKTKSSTGIKLVSHDPLRDANGNLEGAKQLVIKFQSGTVFNTNVPGKCSGDPAKCSRKSRVGSGEAQAITGISSIDPVKETITAFNKKNGLIVYLQGIQTASITSKIKDNVLTSNLPFFPVPGNPKGAKLVDLTLNVNAIRSGSNTYIRTPSKCTGKWTVKATYTFPTIPQVKDIPTTTKCRKP